MIKFLSFIFLATSAVAQTTYTTNYNLAKPADGNVNWGSLLRDNLDTIDTQLFSNSNSITTHINDTTDAHLATAIGTTAGSLVCTSSLTVQAFLTCLDSNVGAITGGTVVTTNTTQTITGVKTFTSLLTASSGLSVSGALTFSSLSDGVLKSSTGSISSSTIVDADVSASAAITRGKIASGTADHVVINNGSGVLSSEAQLATSRGGTGVSSTATFPASGVVATVPSSGVVKSNGSVLSASNVNLTSEVTGTLPVANGGTGITSLGSANQLLGVNSGATANEYKTLNGTTNRITVTHGANSITLSAPQDLNTSATPTFGEITTVGLQASSSSGLDLQNNSGASILSLGSGGGTGATFEGGARMKTSLLIEDPGAGTNTVTIQAPTLSGGSYTLTLPVDDGNTNQVLSTNGTGTLSWADASSGYTQSTSTSLSASGSITIGTSNADRLQSFIIGSASGAITLSTSPFGTTDPQDRTLICLVGNSDTNTVTIPVNDAANGMVGNGDVLLGQYDSACFRYYSTFDRYVLESWNK